MSKSIDEIVTYLENAIIKTACNRHRNCKDCEFYDDGCLFSQLLESLRPPAYVSILAHERDEAREIAADYRHKFASAMGASYNDKRFSLPWEEQIRDSDRWAERR